MAPTGELVKYVHMGYASTYDAYRVFTVVAGFVTADRATSRREFEASTRRAESMSRVFDEEP